MSSRGIPISHARLFVGTSNHKIACGAKGEGDEMEDVTQKRCNDRCTAQRERERDLEMLPSWL